MGRLISVLAAVLTCAAIALSADLFRVAGLSLYTEQVLAGLLAIATPLELLHVSAAGENRSEEDTSGLQPQSNPVCRLLLEKKNPSDIKHPHITAPHVLYRPHLRPM